MGDRRAREDWGLMHLLFPPLPRQHCYSCRGGDVWNFPWRSCTVQFSSVQPLVRFGRRGDMTDDSTEVLFQSFLQAIVSSSSMGKDVHSLTLSIQHFLCRPRHRLAFKVPRRMVLEELSMACCCHGSSATGSQACDHRKKEEESQQK